MVVAAAVFVVVAAEFVVDESAVSETKSKKKLVKID